MIASSVCFDEWMWSVDELEHVIRLPAWLPSYEPFKVDNSTDRKSVV